MEECEVLCNYLGIMVNGVLVCIGACQELKQKFGAGYDIRMKLNPSLSINQIDDIKNKFIQSLDGKFIDENPVRNNFLGLQVRFGMIRDLVAVYV